jgi:hypothetical protein
MDLARLGTWKEDRGQMKNRSLIDRACRLLALCAICATFVLQHRGAAASDSDFFKEKVAPIFERNCVMCHGARVQRSGLDLRSEETTLKGGARGHAVVPRRVSDDLWIWRYWGRGRRTEDKWKVEV